MRLVGWFSRCGGEEIMPRFNVNLDFLPQPTPMVFMHRSYAGTQTFHHPLGALFTIFICLGSHL